MSSLPSYLANKPGGLIPNAVIAALPPVLISGREHYAVTAKQELFEIYKTIKEQLSDEEQARLLYRAKGLYDEAFPKAKRGGDHRSKNFKASKENQNDIVSFCSHAAKYTKRSERTIQRLVRYGMMLHKSETTTHDKELNHKVFEKVKESKIESFRDKTELMKIPATRRLQVIQRAIDKGFRSVRSADHDLKCEELLQTATYDFDPENLKFCDFRAFLAGLKEQPQLIVTDIPYDIKHGWVCEPLAKEAKNILKPGGSLLVLIGQYYIFPQAIADFTKYLDWNGMISCEFSGHTIDMHDLHTTTAWRPMLWLRNGDSPEDDMHGSRMLRDACKSKEPKKLHPHQQSIDEFVHVIKGLALPGDLVVDPFMGSGTVGEAALRCSCRFMGCDDGSCNEKGEYDGVGVGDRWVRLAQARLDAVSKELKKDKPEALISAPLPILGTSVNLTQLTA